MPTLPLSRLPDQTVTPLASAYEYSQIDLNQAQTLRSENVLHLEQPSTSSSWASNIDLVHSYPLLRVPPPVYLVPPNPFLLRQSPGKNPSFCDQNYSGTPVDSKTGSNFLLPRECTEYFPSSTLSYVTGTSASYSVPAIVYTSCESPFALLTRPCNCPLTHSNCLMSSQPLPVMNNDVNLRSSSLNPRGSVRLHSICPSPVSMPLSELTNCPPCPTSGLYSAHDLLKLTPNTYSDPASSTFVMENSDRLNLPTELGDLNETSSSFPLSSLPHNSDLSTEQQAPNTFTNDNESGAKESLASDGCNFSTFLNSSVSDIPLSNLEELLARSSIDDVYVGPVKDPDGKLLPLDPSVRSVNKCLSMPYSSTSLAFSPPGIIMVTEMWPSFVNDRLSHCNHRILSMNVETLRNCLYDHGLNQLGSPAILRRRLQEFVRRVRNALSNSGYTVDGRGLPIEESDEVKRQNVALPCDSTQVPTNISDKMVKLPKPVILTPDTFYSYLLIIDLEATCDFQENRQNASEYPHEIIEFPVLLYNTRTRRCVGVFHSYCKPKLRPDLTSFCTSLTQISQGQVDNAHPFPYVLAQIEKWLFEQHGLSDVRCAIVCDCSADMSKFMRIQCRLDQIPLPSWAAVWINLSKAFRIFYKLSDRHRVTLSTMLHDLNLSFLGQQHRGMDDAINILRVVRTLLADGCLLRVNERVDFGRPPNYVTSVPRLVAEATSGLMGSRLILLTRKSKTTSSQNEREDKSAILPSDLPEDHRQSLLWLASVQKSRPPRDH